MKLLKILLYVLIAMAAVSVLTLWFQFYIVGHYYQHAGIFFAILLGLSPVLVVAIAYKLMLYLNSILK
jgi:hypothetical protein